MATLAYTVCKLLDKMYEGLKNNVYTVIIQRELDKHLHQRLLKMSDKHRKVEKDNKEVGDIILSVVNELSKLQNFTFGIYSNMHQIELNKDRMMRITDACIQLTISDRGQKELQKIIDILNVLN